MNYQEALEKLEKFRAGYKLLAEGKGTVEQLEELEVLYGVLEETIHRFTALRQVEVINTNSQKVTYSNYIEAGLFSDRTFYTRDGYHETLKVIGKIQQHAVDPAIPQIEPSVTNLVQILRRFRECCQFLPDPPPDERRVQDIIWIMLRSQFDRVDREETLARFGTKSYRPDFGIPDLQILVEAKFVGPKTNPASIQEEILADVPGYLAKSTTYKSIVVLVYDAAQKLRDSRKFEEDLKSVPGITDVLVIPGVGSTC